ncbi:hypothetical protein RHSIM_Rhsim10G0065600 [Rhododendron simsii]|uniref:DUF659 domain-containing protein n=1 Tax=Rhododendron simsii TaxID=118357 RepID=A0A834GC17_RHOSS|nr:hypothetical protein RHSIM_Rhsim10G0065600 [Rhododendron simsii]
MAQSQNVSAAASYATTENSAAPIKRQSNDVGWEYGTLVDPSNLDKVKCILCRHQTSGGIEGKKKRIDKKKAVIEIREEVAILKEEEVEVLGSRKRPNTLGPIDKYVSVINPEKKTRQQNINDALRKQRGEQVDRYLAPWVYEAGIPFHAIDNDNFKQFCEAVGQFGSGYQRPSQQKLWEPLLKAGVEKNKTLLKKQEEEWASTGCSIMTNAWTDRKRRTIMNWCVNCKQEKKEALKSMFETVCSASESASTCWWDGELKKAKQEIIEAYKSNEAQYKPILDIMDAKDVDAQAHVINQELLMYKNKAGVFGKAVALRGCEVKDDNYYPEEVVEMLKYESYMKKILYRKMTPKRREMRRLTSSPMETKFWKGYGAEELEEGDEL